MNEVICFTNQKGGVGKTTLCGSFGAALSRKGYRVLVIDLDPQGNLTYSLNAEEGDLSSVLTKTAEIKDQIVKTQEVDLIAADPALNSLNTSLTEIGKEFRLQESLKDLKKEYDYILIDTPPGLGILTINALVASDGIIIPAQADIYSLQGIGQLYQTIQAVRDYCNSDLKIKGIVLNRFNPRTVISRDMSILLEETAKALGSQLYKTKIRECTALKEAVARKDNIFHYNKNSNASKDINQLIEEVLNE